MKRNFNELLVKMKPAAQERIRARSSELIGAMALADLRRAYARTQQQLAETLHVNQAWISRVERQTDMYLSTLRGYIEALGGELELTARFGNRVVPLDQFADLASLEAADSQAPSDERNWAPEKPDGNRNADSVPNPDASRQTDGANSPARLPNRSLFRRPPLPATMLLYGGGIYRDGIASAPTDRFLTSAGKEFALIKRMTNSGLVAATTEVVSTQNAEGFVADEENASVTTAA